MKKSRIRMMLSGAASGLANGFFGSGGGIIAVPMLKSSGFDTKRAHASALAVTLPLSAVSVCFYLYRMDIDIKGAAPLILPGLAGAALGTVLIRKIPTKWLSRLFGAMLVIAGVRGLAV